MTKCMTPRFILAYWNTVFITVVIFSNKVSHPRLIGLAQRFFHPQGSKQGFPTLPIKHNSDNKWSVRGPIHSPWDEAGFGSGLSYLSASACSLVSHYDNPTPEPIPSLVGYWAGIFKNSMGARHRLGTGLSYRPARLHRLAELMPWHRFLGSIQV